MLEILGNDGMVATTPWPDYDPALVTDNQVTLPVQINGKKRGELTIDRNADQAAVEQAVLALEFRPERDWRQSAAQTHHRSPEDRQCCHLKSRPDQDGPGVRGRSWPWTVLAGCQAQPLYGSMSGANQSITVSEADSRVEQVVRNELVLGFGGEQQNGCL
jgi:leucyl-tRNA synthetase